MDFQRVTERGNILFLILLAVVLFAALSYAVTQSTRGGGNNASSEKNATLAAQIIQQGTMLEQVVQRLRISSDCRDRWISFVNTVTTNSYTNGTSPNSGCNVFGPAGGASLQPLPKEALDSLYSANTDYGLPIFTGTTMVLNVGIHANADLLYVAPYLSDAVCKEINTKLWGYGQSIVEDNLTNVKIFGSPFTGGYSIGYADIDGNGAAGGFWNAKMSGCARTFEGVPFYYHVLWAR